MTNYRKHIVRTMVEIRDEAKHNSSIKVLSQFTYKKLLSYTADSKILLIVGFNCSSYVDSVLYPPWYTIPISTTTPGLPASQAGD
jgi:hypothetical protein